MISIFTDASVSSDVAAITHLVLSDELFIGYNYLTVPGVYKSYIGELVGIREGLKYYVSLNKDSDCVTLYTDSDKALELLAHNVNELVGSAQKICKEIHALCAACNATIEHYVGHQHGSNPNQIADSVAHSVLRGVLKRGEIYEQVQI